MKFSPFIVTAFAVFSLGLAGCQKSAKEAAKDGNHAAAEASALNQDLFKSHGVICYTEQLTDAQIQAYADRMDWSSVDRVAVRSKLNALIAKVDKIFKIDKRKDIKVTNPESLRRAKANALAYLRSLDRYETAVAHAPKRTDKVEENKTDKTDEKPSEGYGGGGRGTLPTWQ